MVLRRLFPLCLLLLTACMNSSADTTRATESAPTDTAAQESAEEISESPSYQLVWQDEFDGDTVDATKWTFEVHGRPANNELQYYTDSPENAFIEDGKMVLQALKLDEKYLGRDYTSVRMKTAVKAEWMYGRFEIRAKLPEGQGLWPAIWMLPTFANNGGWPAGGEIDIMELLGHEPNIVHGTIHYRNADGHRYTGGSYTLPSGDFASKFHTFALEWDETEMRWYVDDELYLTQTKWEHRSKPFPAPFNQKFHLLLNVAVGGNWPGNPDETTVFPQRMEVDYVRVYQK